MAVAYGRAYHQIAPEPRIFTDPLAVPILGTDAETILGRVEAVQNVNGVDPAMSSSFLAARSRFAEETVAAAVAEGAGQVVLLGAGLDTLAYRNPYPHVRVFEVDHPVTQDWKRELLAAAGIAIPDTVRFAPVDFETGTLAAGLAEAGFDRSRPAVFLWLGVVMYLTRETIIDTLRFVAGQGGPVWLVFDYVYPPADSAEQDRAGRYAAIGEPWLSFFTSAHIADVLGANGFDAVEDVASPDLIAHYLGVEAPAAALTPPHLLRARRTNP